MSDDDARPDRVILRHTGDAAVALFGGVYASSYLAEPGAVIEVDGEYGRGLLDRDEWETATRDQLDNYQLELTKRTPVEDEPPPSPYDLKGQALTDALVSAGLDTTGTADEKRDRLAEHLGMTKETDQ